MPAAPAIRYPAAPGYRAAAWLLDIHLSFVPAALLAQIMTAGLRSNLPLQVGTFDEAEHYLTLWLGAMIIQALWTLAGVVMIYGIGSICAEGGPQQATWGKRWLGLEVVDMQQVPLDHQQAALRFAAGSVSWLTLNIGHAIAHFRKDRRMLHDLIARTQVMADGMKTQQRVLRALSAVGLAIMLGTTPMLMMPDQPGLQQSVDILANTIISGTYPPVP